MTIFHHLNLYSIVDIKQSYYNLGSVVHNSTCIQYKRCTQVLREWPFNIGGVGVGQKIWGWMHFVTNEGGCIFVIPQWQTLLINFIKRGFF